MEPDEFVDAGDRVVAIGRWVGKGRGSGVEVNQPIADVFTLHGGRVVRCEIGYSDRAKALEVAGPVGVGDVAAERGEGAPVPRRVRESSS
jgi:ketosteroid isomerase-like protein